MIAIVAGVLLVIRLVVVKLLDFVIKRQRKLLKRPISPEARVLRKNLHAIALSMQASNLIPIVLDSLILLDELGIINHQRTTELIITYAISNSLFILMAAYMLYSMYKLSEHKEEVDALEEAFVDSVKDK